MRLSALIPGIAGVLLTACSGGILGPGAAEMDDIREMKTRILDLQKQATETEAEIASLRAQVAELERQLEERGAAERRFADTSLTPVGQQAASSPGGAMAPGVSPPLVAEGIEESDLEVADVATPPAAETSPARSRP